MIGGASINNELDTDLLLSFEYRKLKPTIYINIFGVTHYAHFINTQRYREEFESLIERIDDDF